MSPEHPLQPGHRTEPRRLSFVGAVNFRDLGGYATTDGRCVAMRRIYRSDSLSDLNDDDLKMLAGLGLRSLCDFRLDSERQRKPNRLPSGSGPRIHEIGFAPKGTLDMWREINAGKLSPAEVEERMREHYRMFVVDHLGEYRRMFDMLLAPDALPALIHCASGKDRTGVGSALLLMALGVPRETILEDYLLSDLFRRDLSHILFDGVDESVLSAVVQAHPSYLTTTFETIDLLWRSDAAFIETGLGLHEQELARFRQLLLEPAA